MGGFVEEARELLSERLKLPEGYYLSWGGQYENQIRAKKRLQILVLAIVLIIFVLLYFTFRSVSDSLMVILSVPFALVGGVLLQYKLGYNFSVAVSVGYIALAGVAVETGVVMLVYLEQALNRAFAAGQVRDQRGKTGYGHQFWPQSEAKTDDRSNTDDRWHDHLDHTGARSLASGFFDDKGVGSQARHTCASVISSLIHRASFRGQIKGSSL